MKALQDILKLLLKYLKFRKLEVNAGLQGLRLILNVEPEIYEVNLEP